MGFCIIKYSVISNCKEEVFHIKGEDDAIDLLFEAEETKNTFTVNFDEPSGTLMLRLAPLNALLVFKLHAAVFDDDLIETKAYTELTYFENRGENLAVIKKTIVARNSSPFKKNVRKSTRYFSVGRPKVLEEKEYGMIKTKI